MKILGTPIKLNRSFFIGLVYFSVAIGWTNGWMTGIYSTLIMYGLVIVHELGHLVAAKIVGVNATSLNMIIMGGFVEFDSDFKLEVPIKKLVIAAGGPFINLIILLIFGINDTLSVEHLGVVEFFKLINLAFLVFNVLPILPLDGGKMTQYIFECFNNNEKKSEYYTTIISSIMAMFAIIVTYKYKMYVVLAFVVFFMIMNVRHIIKYRKNEKKLKMDEKSF